MRDRDEYWLLTARVAGEVTGALTYRIDEHGGTLHGNELLVADRSRGRCCCSSSPGTSTRSSGSPSRSRRTSCRSCG
ncbi:hypothetical protein NKG94_33915 [Micromonospora sp. M12]